MRMAEMVGNYFKRRFFCQIVPFFFLFFLSFSFAPLNVGKKGVNWPTTCVDWLLFHSQHKVKGKERLCHTDSFVHFVQLRDFDDQISWSKRLLRKLSHSYLKADFDLNSSSWTVLFLFANYRCELQLIEAQFSSVGVEQSRKFSRNGGVVCWQIWWTNFCFFW